MKALALLVSHAVAVAVGFAAGIYVLPILTAPKAPSAAEVRSAAVAAEFQGQFRRDLAGSDLLHWGEGTVSVGKRSIALAGKLAPGPDYKLYLAPQFVDTREGFLAVRSGSARVGDVKTFANFVVPVPEGIDVSQYDTVVVWCEAFSMFISAAKYR